MPFPASPAVQWAQRQHETSPSERLAEELAELVVVTARARGEDDAALTRRIAVALHSFATRPNARRVRKGGPA
jgi:hypothetical protein